MPSYEMFPLIFKGVEMILFENNVLKMYLLNTQLNFQLPYIFMWLFHCLYLLHIAICLKYMIKGLIRDLFHRIPAIIPQSISVLDCVSGWYQMICKRSCINFYILPGYYVLVLTCTLIYYSDMIIFLVLTCTLISLIYDL